MNPLITTLVVAGIIAVLTGFLVRRQSERTKAAVMVYVFGVAALLLGGVLRAIAAGSDWPIFGGVFGLAGFTMLFVSGYFDALLFEDRPVLEGHPSPAWAFGGTVFLLIGGVLLLL